MRRRKSTPTHERAVASPRKDQSPGSADDLASSFLDDAPTSADGDVVHPLLQKLEVRLTEALAMVPECERNAAKYALDAALEFVGSVPGWNGRLGDPLFKLLAALHDLEFGRVGPLLAPNPAVSNRKPDAGMRKIVKAYALLCVDVLLGSGWSVTDASKFVAKTLYENGFPLAGRLETPSWKSVSGWRHRLSKLVEDDQTRVTYEGLKDSLNLLKPMSKDLARDWVRRQLRVLLSQMGSSVLE